MNILAYYPSYKLSNHDLSVALVKDGEMIYAFEEQKLSRVNHREAKYIPERAMLSALYTCAMDPREIDMICICGPEAVSEFQWEVVARIEKYFGISTKSVVACPHHLAHSALSVLGSGYDTCVYWTLDHGGEDKTWGELGVYKDNKLNHIFQLNRHSLPTFYFLLTACCGFADFEEGKVMGLASYGQPDNRLYEKMRNLFEFDSTGQVYLKGEMHYKYPKIRFDKFSHDQFKPYKVIQYLTRGVYPPLDKMTRKYLPEIVAATGQKIVQDLSVESLKRIIKINGLEKYPIALGGGFFQNIIVNKEIRKQVCSDIFIPVGVGDMGLAAGAALWASSQYDSNAFIKSRNGKQISPYLGPEFTDKEIGNLLKGFSVEVKRLPEDELVNEVADCISHGKVVGWFQGRGEFGARALGARSVLADPRDADSKARVNQLLKKRDWFMPYAPSILEEHAGEFLQGSANSPYMTMGFDAVESSMKDIPSAVHVDGTIRPQIVRREDNPLYHKLISKYFEITGVPLVLNTSFNRHGVPIVATPRQAIEHLMEGVVDVLCIGCFVAVQMYKPKEKKNEHIVPENVLKKLLGIRHGYSFLEEGDKESANAIFKQTGYKIYYEFNDELKVLTISGCKFDMTITDWSEIAIFLANESASTETDNHLTNRFNKT